MPILPIDEELVALEDGFFYFWPKGCVGCFSADNLRQIADQLDETNKEWEGVLEHYFELKK